MRYALRHETRYAYQETVDLAYHVLHLTPRALPHQLVWDHALRVTPTTVPPAPGTDYFGNSTNFLTFAEPHDDFVVEMTAQVEVMPRPALDPAATPAWETVRDALNGVMYPDDLEASEFVHDSPLAPTSDGAAAVATPSFTAGRPLVEAVIDLTARIFHGFTYDPQATAVTTPLSDVLEQRRGVCQDFAHVEVAALRSIGLAARYVSGYIRTYAPDSAPRLTGADGSHAWVSVFCPGVGWVDVDPTNNLVVKEEHIVLGWGRDFADVSPVRGFILGGGQHMPSVGVDVIPLG
jgi:transglutaminase-like putative cysteine protease